MSTKTQPTAISNQNGNHDVSSKNIRNDKYKKFKLLKEQEDFLQKLKDFHKSRGTPLVNFPTFNGKPLDLLALYNKVCSLGGWEKLCEKEKWDSVAEVFNLKSNCLNGSHALRNIYIRYLALFEKVHYFGEEPTFSLDDEESRKKFNRTYLFIPKTYNHGQHTYSIANIERMHARRQCEKLELSLTCGLPNEIDFAFNTILLLSSNETQQIQFSNNPRLLSLMLAHIGFFDDDSLSYRMLYDEWRRHANRNFVKFWHDTVQVNRKEIRNLLANIYNKVSLELPSQELLGLSQLDDSSESVEVQRIEQVLISLFNYSFDAQNLDFLAQSKLLFRFLIICTYCCLSDVKNEALDLFGNLSKNRNIVSFLHKFKLNTMETCDLDNLFYTIDYLIKSDDRYEVMRALEILSNLCHHEDNEEILIKYLNIEHDHVKSLFETIQNLLNVHDILILNSCLECLYQMSLLSTTLSTHFTSNSLISLLISYLTIDESYFQAETTPSYKLTTTQEKPFELPTQPIINLNRAVIFPILNGQIIQVPSVQMEHHGKYSMINWLKNAFSIDLSYRITRVDLYNWYRRTADLNSWHALSQDDFFIHLSKELTALKLDDFNVYGLKPSFQNNTSGIGGAIKILPKSTPIISQTHALNLNESSNSSTTSTLSTSSSLTLKDPLKITSSLLTSDLEDIDSTCDALELDKVRDPEKASDVLTKTVQVQRVLNESNLKRRQSRDGDAHLDDVMCEIKKIRKDDTNDSNNDQNQKLNNVTNLNQDAKLQQIVTSTCDFVCEWDNCKKTFSTSKLLFNHTCKTHIFNRFPYSNSAGVPCLWNRCEQLIKRQKWSLINHIQDKHCNTLNGIQQQQQQQSQQKVTQPIIYDKYAAYIAIRNQQKSPKLNDFVTQESGPLSRTIRLLAALIIRNLTSKDNTTQVKRHLKIYEQHLCSIAFDLVEASNAITQCLWFINFNN